MVIEQRMAMHLNYGKNGHSYFFDIFVQGKKSPITRHKQTRHGRVTKDFLCCDEECFDILGVETRAIQEWIGKRANQTQNKGDE